MRPIRIAAQLHPQWTVERGAGWLAWRDERNQAAPTVSPPTPPG